MCRNSSTICITDVINVRIVGTTSPPSSSKSGGRFHENFYVVLIYRKTNIKQKKCTTIHIYIRCNNGTSTEATELPAVFAHVLSILLLLADVKPELLTVRQLVFTRKPFCKHTTQQLQTCLKPLK